MTREMFLQELRIALQGQITQVQVNEQLRYYENYIIEESRKGRTEGQVLESLGSPRLIAKTIIQVANMDGYENAQDAREAGRKEESRFERLRSRFLQSRIAVAAVLIFILILMMRFGILLMGILAFVFMAGAILRLIFQIFFGNKK